MKKFPSTGWMLIYLLTAIPVARWGALRPLSDRFADMNASLLSIGQLTGIAGIILFVLSLAISARLKLFDGWFGGINRAYIVHHQIGGVSLLLLLVHPIAIATMYATFSLREAALLFIPGENWTINLGIASLLSLMGLLVLTYFATLKYQTWKFTHQWLGPAYLLGGMHGLFVESDIKNDMFLFVYLLAISCIGLLLYTYRTLLGNFLVKRYRYRVSAVVQRTHTIVQISFVPAGNEAMLFLPGQFVFIRFLGKNVPHEPHPFSISSAPTPMGFVLSIKALGDYTKHLRDIPVGTQADIEGPYGRFIFTAPQSPEMIWVAGGIGITPFLSMAASMPRGARADLYYCVPTEADAVYLPDLSALVQSLPGLRIIPWYTKTQGHLTAATIRMASGDFSKKSLFLCGPPSMMHALKQQCVEEGMDDQSIHSEEFAMLG